MVPSQSSGLRGSSGELLLSDEERRQKPMVRPLTDPEAVSRWGRGEGIPLDLVPTSYWHKEELPRFGEEQLGKDF